MRSTSGEIVIQLNLLPQRIRRIDPCTHRSADALGIGIAASGQRYLLKATVSWHPLMPVSEWICHALARSLELAVPEWDHCVMPDGRDAIGSRLEGNVLERDFFPVERPSSDNEAVVSGTYVLDLFVANGDRHSGQWLLTEAGGGTLLRPIDFSRAWFKRWPLPTPPFGPGASVGRGEDQSGRFYDIAKRNSVVLTSEALDTWERLHTMPKNAWRSIVSSVPPAWIDHQQRTDLINWWWSPQWRTRVSWIRTML